jgi:glycosyltransferase involved in cell wall biosynthesis
MIKCGIDNDYFVIPNVAQVDDRNCCRTQKDPKQILHISLLKDDIKNVSGILSAIKKISLRRNDFELHIIGNGLDRKQLQSIAEDYGLLNKVVFFEGMLDDNELSKFFFDCDFFVLNSNYETFSVVTAEALSCGKPVIATKCGGPEEFVNEKCGILIEPKDEDALVIAIDYMLDNFSNYNSNGIREYAANKFGYDAVGKAFLQLYQKVIK